MWQYAEDACMQGGIGMYAAGSYPSAVRGLFSILENSNTIQIFNNHDLRIHNYDSANSISYHLTTTAPLTK
ncbi:hypothetical protein VTL71DRAFT_10167 [Oculimacula yallundae]|uniref:Uncharacterized protein n=1 Tax=Oculimacula yallundae TaxID=86028 RepID=A0ABR4BSY4_9HELO